MKPNVIRTVTHNGQKYINTLDLVKHLLDTASVASGSESSKILSVMANKLLKDFA